ncbi:hypothetical protein Anapl_15109 [Anas platyrhynchos]|uniref:Uncharacterized protein n=1 Tax=Anas platyrhynchos TaxID=8839 RepID=R0JA10_ANAPL|nr:hypothetical protein Anapl_15109 [Anas platyrhynchos]
MLRKQHLSSVADLDFPISNAQAALCTKDFCRAELALVGECSCTFAVVLAGFGDPVLGSCTRAEEIGANKFIHCLSSTELFYKINEFYNTRILDGAFRHDACIFTNSDEGERNILGENEERRLQVDHPFGCFSSGWLISKAAANPCAVPRLFTLGSGSMPIAEHLYSVPEIALPKFQMQKALSSSPEFLRTGIAAKTTCRKICTKKMETYYISFVTELFIALSDQLKECQVTEPLQIAIAELAIQRVGEMRKLWEVRRNPPWNRAVQQLAAEEVLHLSWQCLAVVTPSFDSCEYEVAVLAFTFLEVFMQQQPATDVLERAWCMQGTAVVQVCRLQMKRDARVNSYLWSLLMERKAFDKVCVRGMERNQKSLFGKNCDLQVEEGDEFHNVCTSTVCTQLARDFPTSFAADTEQQQPGARSSVLGTLLHLMITLFSLTWSSSSLQHQFPVISARGTAKWNRFVPFIQQVFACQLCFFQVRVPRCSVCSWGVGTGTAPKPCCRKDRLWQMDWADRMELIYSAIYLWLMEHIPEDDGYHKVTEKLCITRMAFIYLVQVQIPTYPVLLSSTRRLTGVGLMDIRVIQTHLWKPQGAAGLEHEQHQFHQEMILAERFVVLRQDLSAHSTAWLRHSYCTTRAKLNQTVNKQDVYALRKPLHAQCSPRPWEQQSLRALARPPAARTAHEITWLSMDRGGLDRVLKPSGGNPQYRLPVSYAEPHPDLHQLQSQEPVL